MTMEEFSEAGELAEAIKTLRGMSLSPSDVGECYLNDLWLPAAVVTAMLEGGEEYALGRLRELGLQAKTK